MSRFAVAAFALLLSACAEATGPIEATDLRVRVKLAKDTVAPGEGLAIAVVRTWSKALDPSPWDDAMLSPLTVRPIATTRREDTLRVEETRTFRVYAFGLKDVALPAIPFAGKPLAGGDLKITATRPFVVRVRPSLDPATPGPPELPDGLTERRPPWWFLAFVVGIVAFALAGRRRAPRTLADDDPLAALRSAEGWDELADALRRHVAAHYGVPAPLRTTEEVTAVLDDARITDALAACDQVKFAQHVPSPDAFRRMRDSLLTGVEA